MRIYGQRVSSYLTSSRNDDFFDLGGDSLKGAVVAAQVHAALRVELSLGTIADYPTISALAAYIDTCQRAVATNYAANCSCCSCGIHARVGFSRILLALSRESGVHMSCKGLVSGDRWMFKFTRNA